MKSLSKFIAEAKVKQWTNSGLLGKDLVKLPIGSRVKVVDTAFGLMQSKVKTVKLPIDSEYTIMKTDPEYGRGSCYIWLKPINAENKESYSMILHPEQFSGVKEIK